ncbi:MAG: hypothetical protein ACSHX4_11470 [Opitutaceae bacterium]
MAWSQEAVTEEDPLPTLMELHIEHVNANGGRAELAKVQSIMVTGKLSIPDSDEDTRITYYKKRPNKMRVSVSRNPIQIETMYNGKKAWTVFRGPNGEDINEVIDAQELLETEQNSRFIGPFQSLMGNDKFATPVAFEEVDGQEAIRIEVKPEANLPFDTIWISREHFQEIKVTKIIVDPSAPKKTLLNEIFYENFEQVDGVWFAKTSRYFMDGKQQQLIEVDKIRLNPGIYDSYFERQK